MRTLRPIAACFLALALAGTWGCRRGSEREDQGGFPAAEEWQAPEPQASSAGGAAGGGGTSGTNPHAGMSMGGGGASGANPHAGMSMGGAGGDPHAGVNMGGAGDPHAGVDMGGGGDPHAGVNMGGGGGGGLAPLPPPDPNREVDPDKFLQGRIVVTDETREHVEPGAIMFLSVRPIEPVSGQVIGSPLAVDRIDIDSLPVTFHLDGSKAMSGGTTFEGDVMIVAHVDGDGDAITKEPGDVIGELKAKIPADELTLKLDTVLR